MTAAAGLSATAPQATRPTGTGRHSSQKWRMQTRFGTKSSQRPKSSEENKLHRFLGDDLRASEQRNLRASLAGKRYAVSTTVSTIYKVTAPVKSYIHLRPDQTDNAAGLGGLPASRRTEKINIADAILRRPNVLPTCRNVMSMIMCASERARATFFLMLFIKVLSLRFRNVLSLRFR